MYFVEIKMGLIFMHLYSPGITVGGLKQVGSFLFHVILITSLYGCPCFIDGETEAQNDDISFVRSLLWRWQSENSKQVLAFSTVTRDAFVICCVN